MRASAIAYLILLGSLAACAKSPFAPVATPTRGTVPPDLAAEFAVNSLQIDTPMGHLIGRPEVLRGQVMSLANAYALVHGEPLAPGTEMTKRRATLVWLVVTRGYWLLHIPGAPGDPKMGLAEIPAKEITQRGLWRALLFDAVSGELYEDSSVAEPQRDALLQLPALTIPRRVP